MAIVSESFTINVTGENTGETFRGVFKAKVRLSHRDTLQLDQYRRELLGGKASEASQSAQASSLVFSKLWTHLVDAPKWWTDSGRGLDLLDEAPVVAVYDAIIKLENDATEKVKAEAAKAVEALKAE